MDVHADPHGTLYYYVVPADRAGEIGCFADLTGFDGTIAEFINIVEYTEWIRENKYMNVVSYWETERNLV